MIPEQDKQAILNGAYGVTRDGNKVKYLFTSNTNSDDCRHLFIEYIKEGYKKNSHVTLWLTDNFTFRTDDESSNDIVGLWQNKPEPFDLERALAGEPVKLSNGSKAFIKYVMPKEYTGLHPLNGYSFDPNEPDEYSLEQWTIEGKSFNQLDNDTNIIGMWKEKSELNTVTLTLPCPIKDPTGRKWYVNSELDTPQCTNTDIFDRSFISKGCYFETEEHAQAWLSAMQDSRRQTA